MISLDLIILSLSGLGFGIFLILVAFGNRFVSPPARLKLLAICGVVAAVCVMILGTLFASSEFVVTAIVVSNVVVFLFVLTYTVSAFSYIEASITVRLLLLIANLMPVSLATLKRAYGLEALVAERLQRFIASNELIYSRGKYQLAENYSLFRMRDVIVKLLAKSFPSRAKSGSSV